MKENEMVTSKFTKATKYDTGKNPCVATIGTNNKIVEVHEGNGTLWYHIGTLQKDGTIAWKPSTQYDTGSNPAVAAYTYPIGAEYC